MISNFRWLLAVAEVCALLRASRCAIMLCISPCMYCRYVGSCEVYVMFTYSFAVWTMAYVSVCTCVFLLYLLLYRFYCQQVTHVRMSCIYYLNKLTYLLTSYIVRIEYTCDQWLHFERSGGCTWIQRELTKFNNST